MLKLKNKVCLYKCAISIGIQYHIRKIVSILKERLFFCALSNSFNNYNSFKLYRGHAQEFSMGER